MVKFPRLSDKARRTCKIGNNTLIGPSTRVHDEAQVTTSTIGARCSIGAATVLRNAYIFNDVTIGPNCVLESCIIGAGVQIGEGSRIARGSLVADGVKLGPGTVLRSFDRVSRRRQKSTPTTIGNSTEEDESDEGDADSELEEAEQSTLFLYYFFAPPRDSSTPKLLTCLPLIDMQAKPPFHRVWVLGRTPSCGPGGTHRRATRGCTRTRWRVSTTGG